MARLKLPTSLFLFFTLLLCSFSVIAQAATQPEVPADLSAAETPACAETGEHVLKNYVFIKDGVHSAVCALCEQTFEGGCVYADPPAYTANGDKTHSVFCTLCGGEKKLDCTFEEEKMLPTEETAGFTVFKCTVCGYSYTDLETPPEKDRKESRCMGDLNNSGAADAADARSILRAAVNLEAIQDALLPYADLDFDGEILAADARIALRTAVGLENEVRHDFTVNVRAKPSCEKKGDLTCSCGYCGVTRQLSIPATGHSYELIEETDATCTTNGSQRYVCKVCKQKKVVTFYAQGHKWKETTVEPTCEKNGNKVTVCEVCGKKTETPIPAVGHQWTYSTVHPTCTENGSNIAVCGICGLRTENVIPASGHQWKYTTVEPTCTKDGSSIAVCTVCNEKTTQSIPATGHVFSEATASTPAKCRICGFIQTGWTQTGNKYRYFYSNGKPAVNCIVEKWYIDRSGVRCDDPVLMTAVEYVNAHSSPSQTNDQRLKSCYTYLYKNHKYKNPHGTASPKGPDVSNFAASMFQTKVGNCFGFASAFCYIAHVLGYESRVEVGKIVARAGGMTPHGFTGVKYGGRWLVCDAMMQWQYNNVNLYMVPDSKFPFRHSVSYYVTLTTNNGEIIWK